MLAKYPHYISLLETVKALAKNAGGRVALYTNGEKYKLVARLPEGKKWVCSNDRVVFTRWEESDGERYRDANIELMADGMGLGYVTL